MSQPANTWPEVGSTWTDDTGRTLHVTEINPGSKLGRHVVGKINGQAYACDGPTFDLIWRPREVKPEDPALPKPTYTKLYEGTTPTKYTRRG